MKSKVEDNMIERAVDLWCRKLFTPFFDNGDKSMHGAMSMGLASLNIKSSQNGIEDMKERVEKFRLILTENLKVMRDGNEYFSPFLDVDYGPCKELGKAADAADIPHGLFSCKSSVMISTDKVGVSFGYGAENVWHYPLPDGRWLMTSLSGSDIDKIIDHVMAGNQIGFSVEG